jgi:hypothetical protein
MSQKWGLVLKGSMEYYSSMNTTKLEKLDITISQTDYENYRKNRPVISNQRLRSDNEDFFDALSSVELESLPEGKEILETIKNL